MIDRLREVLGAVSPHGAPDARELSELLWLAAHIAPAADEPAARAPEPGPPVADAPPPAKTDGLAEPPAPEPAPEPRAALHHRPAAGTAPPAGTAAEVLVPTAPMLSDPLGVQRALRPVKRRVPSRHRHRLDEDATAARIADTRLWTPVLVPEPERWLTLTLVVDTGPTMRLWRPLARELTEALQRQGAFQNVGVAYLTATGRVSSTPGSPPRAPGTLQDASGRHAVLLLSDCSGPHWWNGRAAPAVRRWAQAGPTAILQPLAESLWRRTAAPTTPGLAVLPRPGGPNTGLRFTPLDGGLADGVPVPVLEVAPRWFGAWARLVSGAGPQPAAIASLPSGPSVPASSDRDVPVAERVRRFLRTASADAAELAAHVAVSVPSLPVMRLIQHGVLGGSDPGRLAEVLLSGLLRPLDDVRYEFVPGAREALLDTLPRPEAQHTRRVLEAVSAEIERRAGGTAETFRALLATTDGPVTLTTDTPHFALLTTPAPPAPPAPAPAPPALLDVLDTPVDDLIGDDWDRPPHPTAIGVDDSGRPVWVDLLRDGPGTPHGTIVGPRAERDRILRTLLFSLALNHSPATTTLAFADFSGGASFVGLGSLPHVVTAVHSTSIDSPLFPRLLNALETERARRENHASPGGRAGGGSASLVVVVDNVGPLLRTRPELQEPLFRLCEEGPAQGIRFVLCSPDETDLPFLPRWRITVPGPDGGDSASLESLGSRPVSFRPAHIALADSDPIVERMRQRGPRAPRLPWPDDEPAQSSDGGRGTSPGLSAADDVLQLNGAGLEAAFSNAWKLPISVPRLPNIGHDPDGDGFAASSLDLAAGDSGLVVGDTDARQHILRVIALALAAKYPPSQMTFAFAGLGEHPLGEAFPLPHVRYSEEELLGRPRELQEFIDFLRAELDTRRGHASPEDLPHLVVMADLSLTFPSSKRQVGEALLQLVQHGRPLGLQLILASSSVESTIIWNRMLPLLDWRIAANRLPPAELRTVLGQANLSFPDGDAYFVVTGDAPRRFTPARLPSERSVATFAEQATNWGRATIAPSGESPRTIIERVGDIADRTRGEANGRVLSSLMEAAAEASSSGARLRPGDANMVLTGPADMAATGRFYGRTLAELNILTFPEVLDISASTLAATDGDRMADAIIGFLELARGRTLLVHNAESLAPFATANPSEFRRLINTFRRFGELTTIVLTGERTAMEELLARHEDMAVLFPGIVDLAPGPGSDESDESRGPVTPEPDGPIGVGGLPERLGRDELGMASGGRIPIGVQGDGRETVALDFGVRPHLAVYGGAGTGKTNVLRLIVEALGRERRTPCFVIDPAGGLRETVLSQRSAGRPLPERYATTSSQGRDLVLSVARLLAEEERGQEVYLVVDDQDLLSAEMFVALHPHLGRREQRLHLVLARADVRVGEEPDPLLVLGQPGFATLRMGVADSAGRTVPGRGVLGQGADHVIVQVAEAP